jgi:hypothetical protein
MYTQGLDQPAELSTSLDEASLERRFLERVDAEE